MLVRLIFRFSKEEQVKFISHLDLMRTLQRALRRAKIPVAYSQGFNPHPRLAFASALAVGMTSEGEYMDILLEKDVSTDEFCERMNRVLPLGIRIIEGTRISNKVPSLMSMIGRADYLIKIPSIYCRFFNDKKLKEFMAQDKIIVEKKTKKGLKNIDIKGMIHHMEWIREETDGVLLKARVSTGSKENLKPDILVKAFLDWVRVSVGDDREPLKIHRLNMYLLHADQWITPMEIE